MNRREVMIGGAALLGTPALAGLYLINNDQAVRAWIEEVVAGHLPGVRIDQGSLAKFTADKLVEIGNNPNHRIYVAALSAGVDISSLSNALHHKLEAFERKTVSDFLLRSDFFFRDDPSAQPVVYSGDNRVACQNPFAVFD